MVKPKGSMHSTQNDASGMRWVFSWSVAEVPLEVVIDIIRFRGAIFKPENHTKLARHGYGPDTFILPWFFPGQAQDHMRLAFHVANRRRCRRKRQQN